MILFVLSQCNRTIKPTIIIIIIGIRFVNCPIMDNCKDIVITYNVKTILCELKNVLLLKLSNAMFMFYAKSVCYTFRM